MKNKIEDILNQRVKSPTPKLEADPFLATRIAAIADGKGLNRRSFKGLYGWSAASLVTSCAIILGIYIGSGLFEEQNNSEISGDLSSVIYQSDYIENLDSVFENGGKQE